MRAKVEQYWLNKYKEPWELCDDDNNQYDEWKFEQEMKQLRYKIATKKRKETKNDNNTI